jgi:phage head maturation protease
VAADDLSERTTEAPGVLEVRSASKREIVARIVPWGVVVDTKQGPELFLPGAFDGTDPSGVVLRMDHEGSPAGRGLSLEQRSDGAWMDFKVSATQRGDEILTLADDRVTRGVSVSFLEVPGGTSIETRNGRRVRVHNRVALREVSTTWRPTYVDALIQFTRSQTEEGHTTVADTDIQPVQPVDGQHSNGSNAIDAAIAVQQAQAAIGEQLRSMAGTNERLMERLERLETRSRQDIVFPGTTQQAVSDNRTGLWMQTVLRMLSGERVSDLQTRALAELITSDNLGVVPDAFINELQGSIDASRPFMETTRELPTPDAGLTLHVPVIVTRPTVGVQVAEKDPITSTPTSITTAGYDALTIAGGGDISLQLLKRSSPSYLDLYLQLLAEAYAIESEQQAISTLLDAGVTPGSGYIDPANLTIGESWGNAVAARKKPTHMWMSTLGLQGFIDAKATGTNAPLYGNIAADITVANGAQGRISGLIPVYVPAMDGSGADVLIGPRDGFAWSEDGTFTLQVDVPAQAGRDVAIVGIVWLAPLYPSAFTAYRLAS